MRVFSLSSWIVVVMALLALPGLAKASDLSAYDTEVSVHGLIEQSQQAWAVQNGGVFAVPMTQADDEAETQPGEMPHTQTAPASQPTETTWFGLPKAKGPWLQYQWQVSVYGSYAMDLFRRPSEPTLFFSGGVSLGFYVRDYISVMMEIEGHYISVYEGDDAYALSLAVLSRWHFWRSDPWTVFFEGGVGILQASENVPTDEGTHFNFTPQVGFGFTYRLSQTNQHLVAGLRYFHMSNAQTAGKGRNPAVDGFKIYAGILFTF